MKKKLLVLKTVGVETEELIKIIKEADILFEKKEEPFNIYEYCKKVVVKKEKTINKIMEKNE